MSSTRKKTIDNTIPYLITQEKEFKYINFENKDCWVPAGIEYTETRRTYYTKDNIQILTNAAYTSRLRRREPIKITYHVAKHKELRTKAGNWVRENTAYTKEGRCYYIKSHGKEKQVWKERTWCNRASLMPLEEIPTQFAKKNQFKNGNDWVPEGTPYKKKGYRYFVIDKDGKPIQIFTPGAIRKKEIREIKSKTENSNSARNSKKQKRNSVAVQNSKKQKMDIIHDIPPSSKKLPQDGTTTQTSDEQGAAIISESTIPVSSQKAINNQSSYTQGHTLFDFKPNSAPATMNLTLLDNNDSDTPEINFNNDSTVIPNTDLTEQDLNDLLDYTTSTPKFGEHR